MIFCRFVVFFLLLTPLFPAQAGEYSFSVQKGINLSNWLANAARQTMNERDFNSIATAGFDHIRLPIDPERMGFKLDQPIPALNFKDVDQALALAQKYRLKVILDLHPSRTFMDALETTPTSEDNFILLWDHLARHYSEEKYPPSQLAFEVINEPHYYKNENHYRNFAQKLVESIRQSSPQRTLIISAPQGSSLKGLEILSPLQGDNLIYDFHFYEPYMITHQGIHRGFEKKMLRYFHDVPYPAALATGGISLYADKAPDQDKATQELKDYIAEGWDAAVISSQLARAKAWAEKNHVRVICGEFGVLRNHIDAASRYRWINDVRQALDNYQIGWDLWDYADLMGIVELKGEVSAPDPIDGSIHLLNAQKGIRQFESAALKALKLHE